MRLPVAVAVVAFVASSGSAMAADCTKGLLWPYVRNTGDCLTDAEIKAGQTGAYSGPVAGPVDVSSIKAPLALPANASDAKAADCKRGWFWPFEGDSDCKSTAQRSGTSAATVSVSGTTPPATVSNPVAATPAPQAIQPAVEPQAAVVAKPGNRINRPAAVAMTAADCHKGLLWPFIRDSGDCPTTIEKGSVSTAAVPVQTSAPAADPVSANRAVPTPAVQATAAPTAVSAGSCGKGWLWPFVRDSGDCSTTIEKGSVSTAAVPVQTGAPEAAPVSANHALPAPAVQATATPTATSAKSCGKGWLWPFVRDSGDCSTTIEKTSVGTAVVVQPSAPAAAPVSVNRAVPTPAVQATATPTATSTESCGKGWLWPFVRNTGDCSTATVPVSGGPVVTPVASTTVVPGAASAMPATASPRENTPATDAASCHKGLFWPFVREAGDCPTDVDRGVRRGG